MKRLAIVLTHPIQYYAPIFQLLAKESILKVFYTWGEGSLRKYDPGFRKIIEWDLPLLEDYTFQLERNTARHPGSHHFRGIQNPELIRHLEDFAPDAMLIFGWAYASHLKVMRHFKGKVPLWFRGDSTLLDERKGWKQAFKSVFLRWVYNHVDLVFCVGENNKNYFLKYGLKANQLIMAPHAVDNARFAEIRTEEVQALRTELGIAPRDKLLLFAGKLEPKKDPMLLLEAFLRIEGKKEVEGIREVESEDEVKENQIASSELLATKEKTRSKRCNNEIQRIIHLLFVGNGVLEESLKMKVQSKKLNFEIAPSLAMTKRVHFMDFQNQSRMPVIYQACDLFCLPSKGPGETWGLALNEAMAAGKAVIASDKVGGAKDLIKEGENGAVFPAGDVHSLADRLKLLLIKENTLESFGKCSAEHIQSFNFEGICSAIAEQLHKL